MIAGLEILLGSMFMKSWKLVIERYLLFGRAPLEKVLMAYVPMHYQFLLWGFIPPLTIWAFTIDAEWAAPPFKYNMEQRSTLDYHVYPALGWMILAAFQVRVIIIASPKRYTRHPVTLKVVKLPVKGCTPLREP